MKKSIKSITKAILTIAIVGLSLATTWAQSTGEFPVPLTDPNKRGKLKAHLNSGSITVKGTARKDVLVKYSGKNESEDKKDDNTKDGLKRISSGTMDLEVSENSNVVKAGSDSWNNPIDLEIEVPVGFDLDVKTYNDGDLAISNIQGEVVLTNYNGEIKAENISGSVVASTYNGEIKVTFDKVTEGTPMSYSTYNGDIDLTFPSTLKASLKMKSEQGEILSGFDMNLVKSGPVQKKDTKSGTYRVTIDDWVKGDINGGGAELTMKNFNGDIIVRKK
jgi:Putative adhesin